jgi:hypothetical protein
MYENSVPGSAGWPPINPAATSVFCSRTALSTSSTVMLRAAILPGSSHSRIA